MRKFSRRRQALAGLAWCGLAGAAVGCGHRDAGAADALGRTDVPRSEGAARQDGPATRAACTLVTRAEVGEIVGGPVGPPTEESDGRETTCSYPMPDGTAAIAVKVDWAGGAAGWQGVRAGMQLVNQTTGSMGLERINEPVAGLGDEAFVQSVKMPKLPAGPAAAALGGFGNEGVLWAKKGDAILTVTVANQEGAKEKATAIARKALGRM